MLGNSVGNGLGFDLFGVSRKSRFLWRQILRIDGVELLMRHLMDHSLDGLNLAHAFLQRDPLLHCVVVALGTGGDLFKANRDRAGPFQRLKEHLVVRDIAGQLIYANRRKRFSIRLTDIEDVHYFESRDHDLFQFLGSAAVRIQDSLAGDGIKPVHLQLFLIRRRGEDSDPGLALLDLSAEILLPGSVSGNQSGVRLLHGDQNCVVQGVVMELGKRLQIILECFTFKECLDSGLQLICDFLYLIELRRIGFIWFLFRHEFSPFLAWTHESGILLDPAAVSKPKPGQLQLFLQLQQRKLQSGFFGSCHASQESVHEPASW